jgi:putative ABC transport system permease protein
MGKATLRGLLAHKLRMALTAVAIVLGVGFMAGTFILTDTMKATFDDIFAQTTAGIDVQVRNAQGAFDTESETQERDPVPASLLGTIQRVDGVQAAEGSVFGIAVIIDPDGKPIMPQGPPTLGGSIGTLPGTAFSATMGRNPVGPDEVVIDQPTFERHGFQLGQRIDVVVTKSGSAKPKPFTLVGAIKADTLGGATFAGFDLPTAQGLFDRVGTFDTIDVAGTQNVDAADLKQRVTAAIGPSYEAITGDEVAAEQSADVNGFIDVLNTALLAFAGIALFVGAFIIHNTFSILIAQRTRELALLRCIGASRRQIRNSVLTESGLVGLFGSAVGIGFGALVALGLFAVLRTAGGELPLTTLQFEPRTIAVSLAVGTLITVASALMPARKATRVAPVAALREELVSAPTRSTTRRTVVGSAVTAAGIAALFVGLLGDSGSALAWVGGGAAVTLLGVGALSPLIARPLARLLGAPVAAAMRLPGRLARQNAMRNPKRTASTAAALMIGVAIISFFSIFAASARASVDQTIDRAFKAEYQVTTGFGQAITHDLSEELRRHPEFATVSPIRAGMFRRDGRPEAVTAIDPATFGRVFDIQTVAGSLDGLDGGVAVSETVARDNGWTVGSTVPMQFPKATREVPVKAVFADVDTTSPYLVTLDDYERGYDSTDDAAVFVDLAPGVAAADGRAALDGVVAAYPTVTVQDSAEFKESVSSEIDQSLLILYALLGLSVLIALFGIVNTLVLSVFERVRELGLLRAVGMERRQVRRMIRWESVIVATIGALLGLGVGTFFGWAVFLALRDQGFEVFTMPLGSMAAFLLLAVVAGIVAAILPGRRASRVDMLRALSTE